MSSAGQWARRLLLAVRTLVITFWIGALWATGFVVTPVLFDMLDDRSLAGNIAGRLFEIMTLATVVSSGFILILRAASRRFQVVRDHIAWLVLAMSALALVGHLGIQPVLAQLREQALPLTVMNSGFAGEFARLHAVSSILYLVQCVLGVVLVLAYRREVD